MHQFNTNLLIMTHAFYYLKPPQANYILCTSIKDFSPYLFCWKYFQKLRALLIVAFSAFHIFRGRNGILWLQEAARSKDKRHIIVRGRAKMKQQLDQQHGSLYSTYPLLVDPASAL